MNHRPAGTQKMTTQQTTLWAETSSQRVKTPYMPSSLILAIDCQLTLPAAVGYVFWPIVGRDDALK
jgi:hypothetical protein